MTASATSYKWLLWQLLAAIDGGEHNYLSVYDVKEMAKNRTLTRFMRERMEDCDFTMLTMSEWDKIGIDFESHAIALNEERKMGISEKGIVLLAAYALQGLQTALKQEK